jgi:hypothetical protein
MPARLPLLCLLLRSSWLTVERDRQVGAAKVHRHGGRAAVALRVGVAGGVPIRQPGMANWRPPRLLLLGERASALRRAHSEVGAIAMSPRQSPARWRRQGESSRRPARSRTPASGRKRAPARSRNLLAGSGPSRALPSGAGAARTSARRLLTRAGSANARGVDFCKSPRSGSLGLSGGQSAGPPQTQQRRERGHPTPAPASERQLGCLLAARLHARPASRPVAPIALLGCTNGPRRPARAIVAGVVRLQQPSAPGLPLLRWILPTRRGRLGVRDGVAALPAKRKRGRAVPAHPRLSRSRVCESRSATPASGERPLLSALVLAPTGS